MYLTIRNLNQISTNCTSFNPAKKNNKDNPSHHPYVTCASSIDTSTVVSFLEGSEETSFKNKSWVSLRKTVGGSCFSGKWGPLQDEFPGKNQENFPLPMRKGDARSSFRWGGSVVKVGILPTGSPTITLRSPQQKSRNPTAWIFGCP